MAINDYYQIVGWAESTPATFPSPDMPVRAFLWTPQDGMINLGTLGGDWSTARDINNPKAPILDDQGGIAYPGTEYGQIVGVSQVYGGEYRGFLWTGAGMVDLTSTLFTSHRFSTLVTEANGINEYGEIAACLGGDKGALLQPFGQSKGYGFYELYGINPLEEHPGCVPKDVSDDRQVVGYVSHLAFLCDDFLDVPPDPAMADLVVLPGENGHANAISTGNATDTFIVGYVGVEGDPKASIWTVNQVQNPDPMLTVLADEPSVALDVNAAEIVVGWHADGEGETFAAMWRNGQVVDLNSRYITPYPWQTQWLNLESANSIAENGSIVGRGLDIEGNFRAFLLIPMVANFSD